MRLSLISIMASFTIMLTAGVLASDNEDDSRNLRDDVEHLKLSNGNLLSIRACAQPSGISQTIDVSLVLHPKDTHYLKGPTIWESYPTKIDYGSSAPNHYYAMVRENTDRIFVFFIWNGVYVKVDKETGRVLARGEGDDVLKHYSELAPLKLIVYKPSTGREMTDKEFEDRVKSEKR